MDVLKTLSTLQADESFRRFQETLFNDNRPRMDVLKMPSTLRADKSFCRFLEALDGVASGRNNVAWAC